MKVKISYLLGLLLVGTLVGAGSAIALADSVSTQVNIDMQTSEEASETSTLGRLALGLSSGAEAMRALRGSQSENNHNKDKLHPPILGMECDIDRIANYVSCYSSPVHSEEQAETLLSKILDELQAVLPSDRWRKVQKEPGTASIRSYSYEDQRSSAKIDLAIIARTQPHGPGSYTVSIFGWPTYRLRGL
jgi:hypothetical protein